MFRKYMHVERFGNDEVQGIEIGGCYVFPKLDGTNASVWSNSEGEVCTGSRNRQLSLDEDNAGFCNWVFRSNEILSFLENYPGLRLYGEWLVPHSLRTYRDDSWRRLYVFDVFDDNLDTFLKYDDYQPLMEEHEIDYVSPLCVLNNATYDNLLVELENNYFLIQEGKGCGEGIVIKNYNYTNRFGNTIWAKMVTNTFKEKHVKTMGATVKNMKEMTENVIVEDYVTKHLVDKAYAKIVNECEGWSSKYIPRLLSTVFYDLVNEETWNVVKKMKNPTINFKTLNSLTILKIKELKPELF